MFGSSYTNPTFRFFTNFCGSLSQFLKHYHCLILNLQKHLLVVAGIWRKVFHLHKTLDFARSQRHRREYSFLILKYHISSFSNLDYVWIHKSVTFTFLAISNKYNFFGFIVLFLTLRRVYDKRLYIQKSSYFENLAFHQSMLRKEFFHLQQL